MNTKNLRELEERINQLGRTTVKRVRLNAPGMGVQDFPDEEKISVVRNGVAETQVITNIRLLDCGHFGQISSISSACDICSRISCDKCIQQCEICGFNVCRYCRRPSIDRDGHERMLCDSCRTKENRRRATSTVSRAIVGFFVSREEE